MSVSALTRALTLVCRYKLWPRVCVSARHSFIKTNLASFDLPTRTMLQGNSAIFKNKGTSFCDIVPLTEKNFAMTLPSELLSTECD